MKCCIMQGVKPVKYLLLETAFSASIFHAEEAADAADGATLAPDGLEFLCGYVVRRVDPLLTRLSWSGGSRVYVVVARWARRILVG